MKIIEYFTSNDKAHWLEEIAKADWGAAKFLHQLLSEGKLKKTIGDSALIPLLTDGEKLVSFCTFAPLDDVQPTELSPWIGFVYTAPEYRGHHYAGEVLNWAESVATVMGARGGLHLNRPYGTLRKIRLRIFQDGKIGRRRGNENLPQGTFSRR